MNDLWQWLACGLLGLWAAGLLLRKFGVWPRRRARPADAGGACGACAHCSAPAPRDAGAAARHG